MHAPMGELQIITVSRSCHGISHCCPPNYFFHWCSTVVAGSPITEVLASKGVTKERSIEWSSRAGIPRSLPPPPSSAHFSAMSIRARRRYGQDAPLRIAMFRYTEIFLPMLAAYLHRVGAIKLTGAELERSVALVKKCDKLSQDRVQKGEERRNLQGSRCRR